MKKVLKTTAKIGGGLAAFTGVLFGIYMTNADSKLIEVIYSVLYEYHHHIKKVEDMI